MSRPEIRAGYTRFYKRFGRAMPLLAALLLVTGLLGAARELLLLSGPSDYGPLGWLTLLANAAIVVISAASLLLFWLARR